MMGRPRILAGWLVVGLLAACDSLAPLPREVSVEIVPESVVLDAVGASVLLQARVRDQDGTPVPGTRSVWTSSDPAVAEVDGVGEVTARARGRATLTATVTGLGLLQASGSAVVEVAPRIANLVLLAGGGTGTAGLPLADPVRIRAVDRLDAPVAGGTVRFEVVQGGGAAAPDATTTGADGTAATLWTLGTEAGSPQRLRVTAGDGAEAPALLVEADAIPGAPARVDRVGSGPLFAVRGADLPEPVSIRVSDAAGNAVPGADVAFQVVSGGGDVTPPAALTDPAGLSATVWTLGPAPGPQTLEVRAGFARVEVTAVATEPPASLEAVAGDGQTAPVGTAVAVAPSVRVVDSSGGPVPGVAVTFTVTAGGGTIATVSPSSSTVSSRRVVSDLDGVAVAGSWILGTEAGVANQALRAAVEGALPRVFTASAAPGPVAELDVVGGDGQTGPVASALPEPVTILATDAWGNAVSGVEARFVPGTGYASPTTAATDATGRAATRWTLGPVAGRHALRVESDGIPPVVVTATGTGSVPTCPLPSPGPGFSIVVCATSAPGDAALAAMEAAVARWKGIVAGDLPDNPPPPDHATCAPGAPWVDGPLVDDLVLYLTVESIDGPGGALAGAAPCFLRVQGGLPLFGRLRLDADDVPILAAQGSLVDVLTHEIGHALGFGTLWGGSGYLVEPSTGSTGPHPDTHFAGPRAVAAFDAVGGAARVGGKVPVQNSGGGGVADTHWRESVLGWELMTAFLDPSRSNPLSLVTVESLGDLGYGVDPGAAEAYLVPHPNASAVVGAAPAPTALSLADDVWWGRLAVVDRSGRVVRTLRRDLPRP